VFNGRTDNRNLLIDEYCGSNVKNKFITLRSNFAYIKFRTGSSTNTRGYTGFANITYEARGTIKVDIINFVTKCCVCIADINECLYLRHPCDHKCINLEGSYKCGCKDGYYLDRNGKTCLGNQNCLVVHQSGSMEFTVAV